MHPGHPDWVHEILCQEVWSVSGKWIRQAHMTLRYCVIRWPRVIISAVPSHFDFTSPALPFPFHFYLAMLHRICSHLLINFSLVLEDSTLWWLRLSVLHFQFHSTFIPFPVRFYSLSFPFLVSYHISIFMNAINNAKRQSLRELKSIDSRTGGDWKSRWISIMHFRESRYNGAVCNVYIWLRLYSGWAWMYQSLFTWTTRHGMPLKLKNKSVVQQHE